MLAPFCLMGLLCTQVLATGLSGLYSSLPIKLDIPSEDWHCLHREDWLQMPSLVQFLNSLEFCNAVIQVWGGLRHVIRVRTGTLLACGLSYMFSDCSQVAHPDIRGQLVAYIYNGFLVPVLAPALHKV